MSHPDHEPRVPDLREVLNRMDRLRSQFDVDLGRQLQSWDNDPLTANPLRAYQRVLQTWQDSLVEMARIIHGLEDDRDRG